MATSLLRRSSPLFLLLVAGCGAPLDEGTTALTDPITVTVAPGSVFARSRLAVVSSENGVTASNVGVAITGAAGEVIQWGQMVAVNASGPTLVPGVSGAVAVTTSTYSSCALRGDGAVWCWGPRGPSPAPVPGLTGVVSIAQSSSGANCAVRSDRTLWCWGRNDSGELGDGTTTPRATPVRVGLSDVVQVSMHGGTTCAVNSAGVAWCWGYNWWAQVGDGTVISRLLPVVVPLFNVVSVQVGGRHTCAVLGSGAVACWGYNSDGAVGNSQVNTYTPAVVSGISRAVAVTAGESHTCAIDSDGAAWCWGRNAYGELGNFASHGIAQWSPVRAAPGVALTEIRAGHEVTCGRSADGRAWCWGSNVRQSLGQPATIGSSVAPVLVPGVS